MEDATTQTDSAGKESTGQSGTGFEYTRATQVDGEFTLLGRTCDEWIVLHGDAVEVRQ